MIPNLTSALILALIGAPALILVMFLPAFLELRRPRDKGPRMIMNDPHATVTPFNVVTLVNIEEEQRFDQSLLQRLVKVIEVLPCLEI